MLLYNFLQSGLRIFLSGRTLSGEKYVFDDIENRIESLIQIEGTGPRLKHVRKDIGIACTPGVTRSRVT